MVPKGVDGGEERDDAPPFEAKTADPAPRSVSLPPFCAQKGCGTPYIYADDEDFVRSDAPFEPQRPLLGSITPHMYRSGPPWHPFRDVCGCCDTIVVRSGAYLYPS